jgi:hypothetical protein
MNIVPAVPPVTPTRKPVAFRRSYQALFDKLKSYHNEWFAIDPEDVSGLNLSRKQTTLYLSAKHRGMKIQTTFQEGLLYIRAIDDVLQAVPHA